MCVSVRKGEGNNEWVKEQPENHLNLYHAPLCLIYRQFFRANLSFTHSVTKDWSERKKRPGTEKKE